MQFHITCPTTPSTPTIMTTIHILDNSPSEFQSNLASIRTSGLGLDIECPQLFAMQKSIEPAIDTSSRTTLYAPFSPAGFYYPLPTSRRSYKPSKSRKAVLGWRTSTLSPSVLSPDPSMLLAADHQQRSIKSSGSPETHASLSFRLLSAASGLSPDVLATQISATAEIALQLMSNSQPNTPYFGGNTKTCTSMQSNCKYQSPSVPCLPTPEMVLPIADINMRELMVSRQDATTGVNPTDTFPSHTSPLLLYPDLCRSPDSSFADAEDNDCDGDPQVTILKVEPCDEVGYFETCDEEAAKVVDCAEASFLSTVTASYRERSPASKLLADFLKDQATGDEHQPSEYEPSEPDCPSDFDHSPFIPIHGSRIRARPLRQGPNTNVPDVDMGSPVVNAHTGITLTELEEKAERYRLRNHLLLASTGDVDYRYDKRWLMSFVGQLSQQGQLIQEYRCYVIGCNQKNKRRDHILIHLGGHLGQRPFKCSECPARFLRKNECKRHEVSHSGERPFKCEFCQTGFVRQDLVKRHIARKHSPGASSKRKLDGDETPKPKRKRTKANKDLS